MGAQAEDGWSSVLRLRAASVGPAVVVAAAVANAALWIAARPSGQPTGRYAGELLGVEAVLLLALTLVLASLLPGIERAFGGLDRVAAWHRDVAVAGILLLVPHVALATSAPDSYARGAGPGLGQLALLGLLVLSVWALAPKLRAAAWPGPIRRLARASYERWLTAHRLTGLFVAAAVAHGALVDPVLRESPLLRGVFVAIGVIGVGAYAYRELVARFVVPAYDYTVADVGRPNDATLRLSLAPVRTPLSFAAGQFVFVSFGGALAWERHPFSVASAPGAPRLELDVKAAGDFTRSLGDAVRPGTPARVVGPFGGFDYTTGGERQLWIAGGIGITPFMSWIRALDGGFDRQIDFWYSVSREADALYLDEIETAARRHPTFRAHLVVSERDGLLTAQRTLNGAPRGELWVYMCGPSAMTDALSHDFHALGIRRDRMRWEDFAIR